MHVQVVPGSFIDSPVVTPRHDNVKKNLIESLVVKYLYHRGYWKFQKDGTGQLHIFKGKYPVFLKNHYLLNF